TCQCHRLGSANTSPSSVCRVAMVVLASRAVIVATTPRDTGPSLLWWCLKCGIDNNNILHIKHIWAIISTSEGIVSKPIQKPVDRLTLFQGISQVLSRCKTT